jgi:polysaccharide export outer membrane protein
MLRSTRALAVACLLLPLRLAAAQAPADYVIGPQDVIAITVWDQEDLAGKFAVETDGTFTFPLIGRVKAGGLTLRELEAELIRRLKDGFFVNPQVTVAIEQYRSQRVFVVGEVRTPGPQALTGDMTLIEALARAGSTLPTAGDEAIIVRPPAGSTIAGPIAAQPPLTSSASPGTNGHNADALLAQAQAARAEVIRVDIRDLQKGVLGQNVRLRDGDTVFVPRAPTMFVFGQVRNPGEYPVRSDTTVLQALSLAGGVTDRGSTGRIRIVRLVDGEKKELPARLNDLVQPGDTVIVQERFF